MADDIFGKLSPQLGLGQLQALRAQQVAERLSRGHALEDARAAKSGKEVADAAKDFEAMLLQQMFQSMWQTVPQGELLGGGKEGEYFRDMFIEGLANDVAQGQGIGIKEVISKELREKK